MDTTNPSQQDLFEDIAPINNEHHIILVKNSITGEICVKKSLTVYNKAVYQELVNNPISGIPKIYSIHEENNILTIIEEYIPGETLNEMLSKNGHLDEVTATDYTIKLCDILSKIHNMQPSVIHRDIKPSNIMISKDNQLYLLDLNAARLNIEKDEDTRLLGTQGYAAPEQYGFGSSSIRTDIYAMGMLINTMLWGSFHKDVYPSSKLTPVIERCIRINPIERFENTEQIKDYLMDLQTGKAFIKHKIKKLLPPGYRSGKMTHILIATLFYLFTAYLCFSMNIKNTYGARLIIERITCFIMFFLIIACCYNYLNIRNLVPLSKHPKLVFKILGLIILITISVMLLLSLMALTEFIFLNRL